MIGAGPDGSAGVRLLGPTGQPQGLLHSFPDGSAGLVFGDLSDPQAILAVSGTELRGMGLVIREPSGRILFCVGSDPEGRTIYGTPDDASACDTRSQISALADAERP
jgi:hypothetical protein